MKTKSTSTILKLTLAAMIAWPVLQTVQASSDLATFGESSTGITELKKKKNKKTKKHNDDNNGENNNDNNNGENHNDNNGGENHSGGDHN